ncbi:MAG: NUDIX hydrolase [Bacteroidota bacterium]
MAKEQLQSAHKFRLWKSKLQANGLTINDIEEIYTKYRYNGEALFGLVLLDATTPEGDKIPPICFIKGEIVSVLICLADKDSGERYLLLVKQRRICNGDYIYEQVAGMVDRDDDPHEVAVRETMEETGLEVDPTKVIPLNREAQYASSGTSDEALYFYYCELEMTKEEIWSYHQNHMGSEHEHERIITHVATIPEAKKLILNTNGLLNIYLYEEAIAARDKG